jgi:protein-tyrosine phosphatase
MKLHTILEGQLYQRGRTNHLSMPNKAVELQRKNITLVVNCSNRKDEEMEDIVEYVHWPFADSVVPDETLLIMHTMAIVRHIKARAGAALVQCNAGRNRSGLLSALVVMSLREMTGKQAVAWVRDRRPNALANPDFVKYLEAFTTSPI